MKTGYECTNYFRGINGLGDCDDECQWWHDGACPCAKGSKSWDGLEHYTERPKGVIVTNKLKEKSLGRLAEDLKVSFSAAKIIHDHAQPKIPDGFLDRWALIFSAIQKSKDYEYYLKRLKLSIACLLEELDIGLT